MTRIQDLLREVLLSTACAVIITAIYMATIVNWLETNGLSRIGLPLLAALYLGLLGGDIKEIFTSAMLTTALYFLFMNLALDIPSFVGYLGEGSAVYNYAVFSFVLTTVPFVGIASFIGGVAGGLIRDLA